MLSGSVMVIFTIRNCARVGNFEGKTSVLLFLSSSLLSDHLLSSIFYPVSSSSSGLFSCALSFSFLFLSCPDLSLCFSLSLSVSVSLSVSECCGVVWHAEKTSVCTGTTPACVKTCGRGVGTHKNVLNLFTEGFFCVPHEEGGGEEEGKGVTVNMLTMNGPRSY